MIAEGYTAMHYNIPTDSGRSETAKLYAEIFKKHQITKEDYTRSYDFYAKPWKPAYLPQVTSLSLRTKYL
jgi:hypothetical protein